MIIKPKKINKDKKIMVYMGSYVKNRGEGKYSDYVTYDGDNKANYKSYMDLKTGEVYNIDMDDRDMDCSDFEIINFVIYMPVKANSFDSYLVNYTNLKNWYLKQLETRSEEDVIEELRQKYEKRLKIAELENTRKNLKNLESELSKIEEKKRNLTEQKKNICDSCNHEVIVKTKQADFDDIFGDSAICLMCNKHYGSHLGFFVNNIKNLIHLDDEAFSNLSEEEKVELAHNMFKEEREANPELSDSKIVEIINDKLKNDKDCIKGKVLSNKPDSVN